MGFPQDVNGNGMVAVLGDQSGPAIETEPGGWC